MADQPIAATTLYLRFPNFRPNAQNEVTVPVSAKAIPNGGKNKCKNVAAIAVTVPTKMEVKYFNQMTIPENRSVSRPASSNGPTFSPFTKV